MKASDTPATLPRLTLAEVEAIRRNSHCTDKYKFGDLETSKSGMLHMLCKELAATMKEAEEMREALRFYADRNNYLCPTIEVEAGKGVWVGKALNTEPIARDRFGGRARALLDRLEGKEKV